MRRSAVLALAVLVTGLAPAAQAHDSFLIAPATVATGRPFVVEATSSGFFPEPETAIRPDRIFRLIARSDTRDLNATPSAGEAAMRIGVEAPGPEGAIVGVSLSPWPIEVAADELDHYMDEIGASPALRAQVEASATARGALRETYTKHLKAIVCGTTCAETGAERAIGLYMEFVSVPDHSDTFVLLRGGEPLADQPVFVTSEGKARQALVTNVDGRVILTGPFTGPVLLTAVDLQPPTEPAGRFTSEWAALTFDARFMAE